MPAFVNEFLHSCGKAKRGKDKEDEKGKKKAKQPSAPKLHILFPSEQSIYVGKRQKVGASITTTKKIWTHR